MSSVLLFAFLFRLPPKTIDALGMRSRFRILEIMMMIYTEV